MPKQPLENIEGCRFYTRLDQRGDRIRVKDCNIGCHSVYGASKTSGLTHFLCGLMQCPDDKLASAKADKLAEKYGIRPEWAEAYLKQQLEMRGIRS